MSPEREETNKIWIPKFARLFETGALVYDIGVGTHNYKEYLPSQIVMTIDRDADKKPDFTFDIVTLPPMSLPKAEGIICIGVLEQDDDPLGLLNGVCRLLNEKGKAFFSVLLTGYPLHNDRDYLRFTEAGALRTLGKYFNQLDGVVFKRGTIPSALLYLGEIK